MATAAAAIQNKTRPISSPINTAVIDLPLSQAAIASGVMVCGDTGNGKVMRVRLEAERSLEAGRQLIYFSNNDRCFGFTSRFPNVLRLGRHAHSTPLMADEGAFYANLAIATKQSMAYDFSEFTIVEVSRFLSDFIEVVNSTKSASMDISFESLDDLIGRKRHRDKNTVNTFKSLLSRGPSINGGNDVRVVVGALSPEEVPIETSRHTMTLIATCTSNPANIEALSKHVRGTPSIGRYHDVAPWGIRFIDDHQQWLWPFADRLMHMPFYSELGALTTDAGGEDVFDVTTTKDEYDAIKAIGQARAAADAAAAAERPQALAARARPMAARARTAAPKIKPIVRRSTGRMPRFANVKNPANPIPTLDAMGIAYPNLVARAARVLISYDRTGTLDYGQTITHDQVIQYVRDDAQVARSSAFCGAMNTNKAVFPLSLATTLHAMGSRQDKAMSDDFMTQICKNRPTHEAVSDLLGSLAKMAGLFTEQTNAVRMDLALAAWKAFSRPKAANDDAALAACG
jgi:hypothetical protein